jgi:hypothetical protein
MTQQFWTEAEDESLIKAIDYCMTHHRKQNDKIYWGDVSQRMSLDGYNRNAEQCASHWKYKVLVKQAVNYDISPWSPWEVTFDMFSANNYRRMKSWKPVWGRFPKH